MNLSIFLVIIAIAIFSIFFVSSKIQKLKEQNDELKKKYLSFAQYVKYAKYAEVEDAHAEAEHIINKANQEAENIIASANNNLLEAMNNIKRQQQNINNEIQSAKKQAEAIIKSAEQQASDIAGNALEAKENAKLYEQTVKSMKNIILGYGNDYIIPSRTLLDDLADTYGYTQASQDYKELRKKIRDMVKNNLAASCDYAETNRRQTAITFITDAFNGKADTILAQAKSDNFGTLRQKLIDAFTIVNYNGSAFRNARINQEFFNMRMEELKLACILHELHLKDLEEQRQIREKMREEEKVRRDIEKALKNAQKEEEMLQKAMAKAREQLEQANAEQRATYEAQIAELERKYQEAEERNKRAMSMAQQTKSGHVYIISNKGSFGENVYKIGMTRRLEPLDRIKELSSASVPFPFEVHAMIWSDDAPTLENMLHKKFALAQVNKVNFRKEFFRIPLADIRSELEKQNLNVKWTIAAETSEYLETLAIEKAIQDNPQAREAWLNRQLELDTFTDDEDTEAV